MSTGKTFLLHLFVFLCLNDRFEQKSAYHTLALFFDVCKFAFLNNEKNNDESSCESIKFSVAIKYKRASTCARVLIERRSTCGAGSFIL